MEVEDFCWLCNELKDNCTIACLKEQLKSKCTTNDGGCLVLPFTGGLKWRGKRYEYNAANLNKILFSEQSGMELERLKQQIVRTHCGNNECIAHLVLISREENNRMRRERWAKEAQEREEREALKKQSGIEDCWQCDKEFKKEYVEGAGKFEHCCSLQCLYLLTSKRAKFGFREDSCYLESDKSYFFVDGRDLSLKELANKMFLLKNNYTKDPINASCTINKHCFNYQHFIEKNYLDEFIESLCEEDRTYFLKVLKSDVLKKLSTYIVEHKILDFLEDKTDNLDFLEKYKKWMEFFEKYHKDSLKKSTEGKVIMGAKDLKKSTW